MPAGGRFDVVGKFFQGRDAGQALRLQREKVQIKKETRLKQIHLDTTKKLVDSLGVERGPARKELLNQIARDYKSTTGKDINPVLFSSVLSAKDEQVITLKKGLSYAEGGFTTEEMSKFFDDPYASVGMLKDIQGFVDKQSAVREQKTIKVIGQKMSAASEMLRSPKVSMEDTHKALNGAEREIMELDPNYKGLSWLDKARQRLLVREGKSPDVLKEKRLIAAKAEAKTQAKIRSLKTMFKFTKKTLDEAGIPYDKQALRRQSSGIKGKDLLAKWQEYRVAYAESTKTPQKPKGDAVPETLRLNFFKSSLPGVFTLLDPGVSERLLPEDALSSGGREYLEDRGQL